MLTIDHPARTIPKREYFNNKTQEFLTIEELHMEEFHLKLEHSLMSISKWESRWHVPFIGREDLSGEELLDYVRCMTVNTVRNPRVYEWLTNEDLVRIIAYMQDENSAWKIRQAKRDKKKGKKEAPEPVEAVYYAMCQYGIPMECEQWHFNRLIALIDYFESKGGGTPSGGGQKKKTQRELLEMYRAINERNRKRFHSKG